jgi:hypothetical protein
MLQVILEASHIIRRSVERQRAWTECGGFPIPPPRGKATHGHAECLVGNLTVINPLLSPLVGGEAVSFRHPACEAGGG